MGRGCSEEVIRRHLDWLVARRLAPRTRAARRQALMLIEGQLGTGLLDATPGQLAGWATAAAGRLAPETAAGYISHLREFYRWAGHAQMCEWLPATRRPRRVPRPIPERDLMSAVVAARPRIRPWLVLAGWAGLRAQEIARQRRECLADRVRPRVIVVSAYAGKGGRERIVPMCDFVRDELGRAGVLAGRSGWCFPRLDGQDGHTPPWLVSKLAGEHLRDCGIPMSLHNFRHRFGTGTWSISHDLRLVQELLGHADPKTTAGYTAWDQPGAAAVVEGLPTP